jgi:CheY-like chemotaxis protein
MNGNLLVQSRLNSGSTFTLELYDVHIVPIIHNAVDTYTQGDISALTHARILVIDDSPMNCQLIKEILKPFNTKTTTCFSGEAGLELLRTEKFDVVLLDLHMPGISGIDVAKNIKNNNLQNMPVLAFTAMNIDASIKDDIQKYFNGVISKPARRDEIVQCLQKHLLNTAKDTIEVTPSEPNISLTTDALHELNGIFLLLQEILRSRKMSDIAHFAEKFTDFAAQYSLHILANQGQQLQQAIATFDIELMMQTFYSINDYLRSVIAESADKKN